MPIENIIPIVWSIVILGGLGAVFGLILGVASKKFAVQVDERVSAVRDLLPGANCGGCGFPGCDGFASSLASGKAEISNCAVLNAETAKQIGDILGMNAGDIKPKVARIMCLGSNGNCQDKFVYDGAQDCRAAYAIASGFRNCRFSCLGLGTCAKVCKFGAIKMGDHGIAAIDEEKCTGCGRCVEQCPQISITVQDKEINVYAACTNVDKGKAVTTVCSAGCIGCAKCMRVCPFEAITMDRGLPVIDYTKCRQCKTCVDACPRMCIVTTKPDKVAYIIEENCIGCGLCKKACAFEAVEGEIKQKHIVNDKCRGCGLCFEKCKKKAIEFKETGLHKKKVS